MKISGEQLPITTCEEDWARIMGDYPMVAPDAPKPKRRQKHPPRRAGAVSFSYGVVSADWFHAGLIDEIDLDELNNVYTLEHNHGWNRFNGMAA